MESLKGVYLIERALEELKLVIQDRASPNLAWAKKGDVSCPTFEFIYFYFCFTLSRFSFRGLIQANMIHKNTTCEMYSCVCLRQCTKLDFQTVAVSAIFEFSGNKFELEENKFEKERETIIFSISSDLVLCPISYCRDVFSPYLGEILDFVVVHWSFIFVSHVSWLIVEFI